MKRQARMQKAFLIFAFGGPQKYSGRNLKSAHSKLVAKGLDDSHFEAVIGHLRTTLKELHIADSLVGEAIAVAESVRNDVLGRGHSETTS